jgi:Nif-specific regulatory protein
MPVETTVLLAPSGPELRLLFEASRILSRHDALEEALPALVALVESCGRYERGTIAFSKDVASLPGLDGSPFGFVLAAGESRLGPDWAASPIFVGGKALGLVAFFIRDAPGLPPSRDDLALLDGLASLIAEAFALRLRLLAGFEASFGDAHGVEGLAWSRPFILPEKASPMSAEPRAPASVGGGPLATLIGRSQAMLELAALIEKVAASETTVLVSGESGTGKELVARAIHGLSPRASDPFVAVNCAALPEALIESELFGHERGAFTGAQSRHVGRFELAAGGTLFLDEVSELAPGLQAKLLRVLQEKSFERVGGERSIRADVRVIAATNRDLEHEVAAGRFRADLYWRLAVFPLRMPPLRERGGDVVLLADWFTEKHAAKAHRPVSRISTPALDLLTSYHWPGNVRELENVIERAVILSGDGVIHAYNLPPSLQSAQSTGTGPGSTLDAALSRLERELLVEALKMESGNAAAAARRLGVSERRMGLALKRYCIDWRRFRGHGSPTKA